MACSGCIRVSDSSKNGFTPAYRYPRSLNMTRSQDRGTCFVASISNNLAHLLTGGGMNTTTNRTFWPVSGGAVAFQPGWFQGHATAQIFINLGYGTNGPNGGPPNMSNPMVPQFGIIGPSKNPYAGTICLPQVPLPVNASVKVGDYATIQVVELAVHGAALYSVSHLFYARTRSIIFTHFNGISC